MCEGSSNNEERENRNFNKRNFGDTLDKVDCVHDVDVRSDDKNQGTAIAPKASNSRLPGLSAGNNPIVI